MAKIKMVCGSRGVFPDWAFAADNELHMARLLEFKEVLKRMSSAEVNVVVQSKGALAGEHHAY